MKVYSLFGLWADVSSCPVPRWELFGVFGSREDAVKYIQDHGDAWGCDGFGLVESELGAIIDVDSMIQKVK
jgi:hypothetical protein